jgi:hypothetical protein
MTCILLLAVLAYSTSQQLDLGKATLAEVRQLPVDLATAQRIFDYVDEYGQLGSIYDLLKIEGITPAKFAELKPLIYVPARDWEEGRLNNIQRIQRRLASEEGPTAAAVEEWTTWQCWTMCRWWTRCRWRSSCGPAARWRAGGTSQVRCPGFRATGIGTCGTS